MPVKAVAFGIGLHQVVDDVGDGVHVVAIVAQAPANLNVASPLLHDAAVAGFFFPGTVRIPGPPVVGIFPPVLEHHKVVDIRLPGVVDGNIIFGAAYRGHIPLLNYLGVTVAEQVHRGLDVPNFLSTGKNRRSQQGCCGEQTFLHGTIV